MKPRHQQIEFAQLPELVQRALARLDPIVQLDMDNVITYHRQDAVFVQLHDSQLTPYDLARLVMQNPGIYFEMKPVAGRYLELRMFLSDWAVMHEADKRLAEVKRDYEPRRMMRRFDCVVE